MLQSSTEHCKWLLPTSLLVLLAGCAGPPTREVDTTAAAEATVDYPQAAASDFARALGLMDGGELEAARRMLLELGRQYPDLAGPHVNLAILAAEAGDEPAARAHLEQALAVCLHCAPAWNQLGILHRRAGRFAEAEQAYRSALASDPHYALAHYNLGLLYELYQQRHQLAVEHYEQYVALAGDKQAAAEVGKWIADLRRRLGQPARTARAEPE